MLQVLASDQVVGEHGPGRGRGMFLMREGGVEQESVERMLQQFSNLIV